MKKIINFFNPPQITIRQQLNKWLIPRKWQHLLRVNHQILINSTYKPFNYLLQKDDQMIIDFNFIPRTKNQTYLSSTKLPNIIFEDDDLLIINKPSGQKSHPNNPLENNTAMNDAKFYLTQQGKNPYMIHRLDMYTSGLMMIAKNPYVVPIMNRQLTNKSFKRNYYAVIDLVNSIPDLGSIELPIGKDDSDPRKRKVRSDGLNSITKYTVLEKNKKNALLKLDLLTGRTHQIRVHLSHIGYPIVGDPLYNNKIYSNKNMMLMAYKISYCLPFSEEKKSVEISIPTDFKIKN
ncbi:RluA family pseudouridine synthase [Companilactobacillus sp. DQM5]|uniref:RluA family pseudouridine synthase n=1 Tax=Companilactobacillus sp. DQM5 TaxID=3463359 RepID=UPI00405A3238